MSQEVRPKTRWDKQNRNKIRIYLYISYAERLKTENDAEKMTPWTDMSIQGVIDALHAGCMKPACRASTPGIDSCFSMEVATLRATCSLHAGFMSIAFSKCRSYFCKCSLHVARITPVCSLRTTVCRMQQAAAGCMRPAWSLHAGRMHL